MIVRFLAKAYTPSACLIVPALGHKSFAFGKDYKVGTDITEDEWRLIKEKYPDVAREVKEGKTEPLPNKKLTGSKTKTTKKTVKKDKKEEIDAAIFED